MGHPKRVLLNKRPIRMSGNHFFLTFILLKFNANSNFLFDGFASIDTELELVRVAGSIRRA